MGCSRRDPARYFRRQQGFLSHPAHFRLRRATATRLRTLSLPSASKHGVQINPHMEVKVRNRDRWRLAMAAGATLVLAITGCAQIAHVIDDPRPFTIAFGGDVHFEGQIRTRLDADPASVFGPIKYALSAADLAM